MYRILLVFLALLLWGCPKHTPTINEVPLTAEIEKELYKAISCARFLLDERSKFRQYGYYYDYDASPIEWNPFGKVDVFLYPKNEQFDLKVVQAAMYGDYEQEWVDVVFNPIKDMSPVQIAQNFNALLVVIDKKYLKSFATAETTDPAEIITYSLKDSKWTKGAPLEITNDTWGKYQDKINQEAEQLISPYKDRLPNTVTSLFVKRMESVHYLLAKEKSADLNGDGKQDYLYIFTPNDNEVSTTLFALLLSDGKDSYQLLYEHCYYPYTLMYNSQFNLVTKGKYFTIEQHVKYSEEDSDNNKDYYITFQVEGDKVLLHRLGMITYQDGKKELQLSTKDFGEVPFEEFWGFLEKNLVL